MSYNITGSVYGGNQYFGSAGLTGLSGGATTHSTGATTNAYSIGGKAYTKAQISGGTTPTTDAVTGATFVALTANKACVFVWCLDSSGNVKIVQGAVQSWTDTSANSTCCPFPIIPDTLTPFAYSVIKGGATLSGSWYLGTNNWNTTGITVDTVVNVSTLPGANPLTA